jgi:hypothetical protein
MLETPLHPASPGRAAARPPARRPGLGAALLLAVSFAVAAPVSVLLAADGGAHQQTAVLGVLCAAAVAVGCAARPAACGVVGLVFWLVFDGFVVHRWGVLGWDGRADAIRLGALVGAGMVGSLLGLVARLWPQRSHWFRRAAAQPYVPELPAPDHPWFWN